jgi:hypothetical protein
MEGSRMATKKAISRSAKAPKSNTFTFGKGSTDDASAIHTEASDGKHHAVGVWHLHVLVTPESNGWFAQAFEIDYGVQGSTPDEAKKRFENGLVATIHHNIDIYGHINHLLKVNRDWWAQKAAAKGLEYDYAFISMHEIAPKAAPLLPGFGGIEYETMRVAA